MMIIKTFRTNSNRQFSSSIQESAEYRGRAVEWLTSNVSFSTADRLYFKPDCAWVPTEIINSIGNKWDDLLDDCKDIPNIDQYDEVLKKGNDDWVVYQCDDWSEAIRIIFIDIKNDVQAVQFKLAV
jgi:hypothetical protein